MKAVFIYYLGLTVTGCSSSSASPSAPPTSGSRPPQQTIALTLGTVDPTFVTRDHFIAALEMQISGEPFAEAMGRDLAGYSRDYSCDVRECEPSLYHDPALNGGTAGGRLARIDIAGFSAAVESYEYSKQPMNNVAFESGAGTSLLFGPVLNPSGATGADALHLARSWVQTMAGESNAVSRFVSATATSNNPMGWPGFWPTLQPFTQWDPTIHATGDSTGCSISSDDDPGGSGSLACNDYECDYTTLHLPDRTSQVNMTIGPGASGWTGWKEALWTLNYLQVMHDSTESGVTAVAEGDLAHVGDPGNTIMATDGTAPGTYVGSSDIEGFQAGNFIQMLDNQAEQWLTSLTTTDGATLGGFATLADALSYSDTSPLRWLPGAITVTEAEDASGFPRPSGYSIASPDTDLLDLAGVLGAFSSAYSLTDTANVGVGGSQPARVYFDGDPFPLQNQTPMGAPTLHDRALAMMRVAIVNMDRLHVDPATGLFVDHVAFTGNIASRGTTLSSDVGAYALLSLRTARRALDSTLVLYSNTTPDTHGVPTPLDGMGSLHGGTLGARLDALITSLAGLFYDKLTLADGHAYAGWDLKRGAPTDNGKSLDAHTAAIRGLLVAYLATGNTAYRDRAFAVFERLESVFYDPASRAYRTSAGPTPSTLTFTPRRFGLLQAALRDTYELIALLPGKESLAALLEDRVGRLNKLVLNGWDDRDQDQVVTWPGECVGTSDTSRGFWGRGGLQMAERVLTGESGSDEEHTADGGRIPSSDREHDCVPEISAAELPAALANSITFQLTPEQP